MCGLHRGVVGEEDVDSVACGLDIGDGNGAVDVLVDGIGFKKVACCGGVRYKRLTIIFG